MLQPLVGAGLELGYCARPGQVDVRLAARGEGARETVARAEQLVRERIGAYIYGVDEEELEAVKWTVALVPCQGTNTEVASKVKEHPATWVIV